MSSRVVNRVCVVGCGRLGEALLRGMNASKRFDSGQVTGTVRSDRRFKELKGRYEGVAIRTDNFEAVRDAATIVVAVKPRDVATLYDEIGDALNDKLLISTSAGVTLSTLRSLVPPSTALVRAMPNTPVAIRQGVTALALENEFDTIASDAARSLFETVGRVVVLPGSGDSMIDVCTALSASGPAFALTAIEAMIEGGVMMGLPRPIARQLAAEAVHGAARLVLDDTERHPAALRDDIATPAGCTIAGLLALEDGQLRSTLARAIEETTRVATMLGKQ